MNYYYYKMGSLSQIDFVVIHESKYTHDNIRSSSIVVKHAAEWPAEYAKQSAETSLTLFHRRHDIYPYRDNGG